MKFSSKTVLTECFRILTDPEKYRNSPPNATEMMPTEDTKK